MWINTRIVAGILLIIVGLLQAFGQIHFSNLWPIVLCVGLFVILTR